MDAPPTDAELVLLGLLAQRPRHAYDLEAVIAERGVREWTSLGFSSIYYVLNKLEARGLVTSERPDGHPKGRRTYALTAAGLARCAEGSRDALERLAPVHAPVLVGMANSPVLQPGQVAEALERRRASATQRLDSMRAARARQEPLEPFVAAIFDYGTAMLRAELAWIDDTLARLSETTMQTYDVKRERRDLYAPKPGRFELVDVPELGFLMVDGHGDPNASVAYREAVEALYATSYAVRAVAKKTLGRVHTVAPLEGLWDTSTPETFYSGDKSTWRWTMMIAQPDWITPAIVADALAAARRKRLPALKLVRFERYAEGRSVQTLHLGPYDDEGPVIARMHAEFMPAHGLAPRGRHHEIYLSDPRRTEPGRLRTILRQPVASARPVGVEVSV